MVKGCVAGVVIEQSCRLLLFVRGNDLRQTSRDPVIRIRLRVNGGSLVLLSALASLRAVHKLVKVAYENAARMVVMRANVRVSNLVGFIDEADQVARNVNLPDGHRLSWGGQLKTSSAQQSGWR